MENPKTPKLENQICFPLYVIAKEITGLYRPFLDELGITYPQYLVMMILWDGDGLTVTHIGEKLFLDSGTLTPLLKRLESKGFIIRKRKKEDERVVEVFLDEAGKQLQQKACEIPGKIQEKLGIQPEELLHLKDTVLKILNKIENK
ncbi:MULTISPECIES: MarR family winged helix-turn-helix transcriptional regulator [Chryseobacterium]|jgi:DNA-binding MarR family transcriptional regulator|uniref:MarR family transcriptional regulator n=4 Tax=Chryseobacterium TaxID=59732 RepID=A0A411DLQ6_CHRID|nr:MULTISPECIES: MarR family transcriptional regulator [Chryseobacterium]QBA21311.1 MarR family transcriptional regulator [Chryseobacterium indologenes]KYH07991.1 MarR family transcriptional regulator [Chryseobacterium cucumeris]MCC3217471.1 MarR family transcriptional regulator [Chryseobacterium sp. X308]MDH5034201.1 MarR family transcriptional regulator [Chryseobacterium cucumeris]MDR6370763.1 DNA-binding MarR family transcriptional regulator [Chryseobacterium vietnamense]